MIIQIIPETEQEKLHMETVEHHGVKEFMIFGNRVDNEDMLVDFHEWTGGYRYLVGSLHYYATVVNEERNKREEYAERIKEAATDVAPELSIVNDIPMDDEDLQEKLDQAVERIDNDDEDEDDRDID